MRALLLRECGAVAVLSLAVVPDVVVGVYGITK